MRVISQNGQFHGRADDVSGNPAITAVILPGVDNVLCKELISQLAGCAVRNETDTSWIDFPVYITGSASWLEAISAGAIYLHDENDAGMSKTDQIKRALCKQAALEDATGALA